MYKAIVGMLALVAMTSVDALAGELNVSVFPRENLEAIDNAFVKPFTLATGVKVNIQGYDGANPRFAEVLRSGKGKWDILQAESPILEQGCKEGWFEKIDATKLANKADLVPGTASECGVGIFEWSHVLAYNADKISGKPSSWADLWDLKKFPGKRGLRRSAKYTLEIALLADGVAPGDVYKVLSTKQGVDRAFRKLEQIKPEVIWWQAAAQPALLLTADRMVMSSSYTLWIDDEQKHGKNLRMVWNGSLYDFDHWAIRKGTPALADVYKFINFATQPESQKAFSTELAYGPTNRKTLSLLDAKAANQLPTAPANMNGTLKVDAAFWLRNGKELEHRFSDWAPPLQPTADEQEEEHHKKPGKAAPHSH